MTREQWKELTPEEQRIKIAELCKPDRYWVDKDGEVCRNHAEYDVPDYLNDLNAMHEAVCNQGLPFCVSFYHALLIVIGHHDHMEMEAVIATAAQRAEAFILAMKNKK